jgi:integrase
MSTTETFSARWNRIAKEDAKADNSVDSYWSHVKSFYRFLGRGAATWKGRDWEAFERWMLTERYSYSSRRQARCALAFTFKKVLGIECGKLNLPVIPKPERRLVVVPTREELGRLFAGLTGQVRLAARLMHGSGTRIEETCRIRVQDIDLDQARLRVWDGKGEKNRVTVLPRNLLPVLRRQIEWRASLHARDLDDGAGFVELPGRLSRKYKSAARELGWQWLLASSSVVKQHRWYLSPTTVSNTIALARRAAGIIKKITAHSLRKAFASELQRACAPIKLIQALLGHANMETTATHYLETDLAGAFSPADVPSLSLMPDFSLPQRHALA